MHIKDLEGKEWEYDECLSCAINSKKVRPFGGNILITKLFSCTGFFPTNKRVCSDIRKKGMLLHMMILLMKKE